jgi:hypothetical protein
MKPLDSRSEEEQARTLEWMHKVFSGSASRKAPAKGKTGDLPMAMDSAVRSAPAGECPNASDTAPPA